MHKAWVEVLSFSNNHIDSRIRDLTSEEKYRFIGFYGYSVVRERWKSWELLRKLSETQSLLWLCAGDFNEIPYDDENVCCITQSWECVQQNR